MAVEGLSREILQRDSPERFSKRAGLEMVIESGITIMAMKWR